MPSGWEEALSVRVRGGGPLLQQQQHGEKNGFYFMLNEDEIDINDDAEEEEEEGIEYEYYEVDDEEAEEQEEEHDDNMNDDAHHEYPSGNQHKNYDNAMNIERDDFIALPDESSPKHHHHQDGDDDNKKGLWLPSSFRMLHRPQRQQQKHPHPLMTTHKSNLEDLEKEHLFSTTDSGNGVAFPPKSSSLSSNTSSSSSSSSSSGSRVNLLLLLPRMSLVLPRIIDKHNSILQLLRKNVQSLTTTTTTTPMLLSFDHSTATSVSGILMVIMTAVLSAVAVSGIFNSFLLPKAQTKMKRTIIIGRKVITRRKNNGKKWQASTESDVDNDAGYSHDNDVDDKGDGDDTMDLDLETSTKKENVLVRYFFPPFLSSLSLPSSFTLESVRTWTQKHRHALQHQWKKVFYSSSSHRHRHLLDSSSPFDAYDSKETMAEGNDRYDSAGNYESIGPATFVANEKDVSDNLTARGELHNEVVRKAEQLQNQLEALSDSHTSLEQEYEASLRMLHDARMQLRQLQQQQQQQENHDENDADVAIHSSREEQKAMIETMAKELEAKYKAQLKDKVDRIRTQTATKLRSELEAEIREELTSQQLMTSNSMEDERMKLEEQLRSEMEERLTESKEQMERALASDFQRAVEEASTLEVNRIIDNTIQGAIQAEKAKAKEEMLRVRKGIQKILDRERQLMREQVMRVTQQVREWVANQQREQLLQQAAVLQEEAERFGVNGGDGGRGEGGMKTGGGKSTSTNGRRRDGAGGGQQQRRPSPTSRRQGASRAARRVVNDYDDEDGYGRYDDDYDGIGGGEED